MSSKAVRVGIIASILPLLFCCVLPIVLSVVCLHPNLHMRILCPNGWSLGCLCFLRACWGCRGLWLCANVGVSVIIVMDHTVIIHQKLSWRA